MRRQFISLLVAVLVGVAPLAHEICLAGCSENAATTAHSHHHHHDDGAQGPEHQTAGHAMDGSDVAMTGHHHEPVAVKALAHATQCCAAISASPRCRRSQDGSTLLVPAMKRVLDPPHATVAHVITILGPPVGNGSPSFADSVIRPPVSLARLTALRI